MNFWGWQIEIRGFRVANFYFNVLRKTNKTDTYINNKALFLSLSSRSSIPKNLGSGFVVILVSTNLLLSMDSIGGQSYNIFLIRVSMVYDPIGEHSLDFMPSVLLVTLSNK